MYKNITIKKRGGGTRKQRVMVLKSGKYKFVKNLTKSWSQKVTKGKKTVKKRRINKMARKKRRRGSRKFTLPIAPIAGLAAGLAHPVERLINGDIQGSMEVLKWNYLGLGGDNRFNVAGLMQGTMPLVLGLLIHKFIGGAPLNANRMLASAGVPILRI